MTTTITPRPAPVGMRPTQDDFDNMPPPQEFLKIQEVAEEVVEVQSPLDDLFSNDFEQVQLKRIDLPAPPLEALPERLRNIVEAVAKGKGVPQEMVLGMLLALGSACIGRARGIELAKDWKEFANLYFLVMAETGVGKSHTFSYIFKHLNHFEAVQKAQWQIEQKKYEEEMAAWKKKKNNENPAPKKPRNIQYLLGDATIEAAVERLEDNPRGLFWAIDEFSGFFQGLDRYTKNGAGEAKRKLLSAYYSETISSSRKSKDGLSNETYIAKGTIGMFGNIQPGLVQSLFTKNDVVQGWPQRFLYIRAQATAPAVLPLPEIDQNIDDDLKKITQKLLNLKMQENEYGGEESVYLQIDENAKEIFYHFINTMEQKAFGTSEAGYIAKMKGMALRIALILHLLNNAVNDRESNEIDFCSMNSAFVLLGYFAKHTQHVIHLLEGKEIKREENEGSDEDKNIAIRKFIDENNKKAECLLLLKEITDAGFKIDGLWKNNKSFTTYLKELGCESKKTNGQRYRLQSLVENNPNFGGNDGK